MYEEQGSREEGNPSPKSPQAPSDSTQQHTPTPPTRQQTEDEEDAAFERELEMAKQLSLAEQRGYERAMAQMKGPEDK
jgi:hypothetical protein